MAVKERKKEQKLSIMIEEKNITILIAQNDGMYSAYCPELDLVTAMDTPQEAIEDMLEAIKDYADEYWKDYDLYTNSPNRQYHLPYIKRIIACKTTWDLMKIIEIRYGTIYV